ncbi:MAG: DUF4199 domain-containing protein [Urechidicola sp.]|nr:DUF4199 domain-containing protein [Urechidicola sp.]
MENQKLSTKSIMLNQGLMQGIASILLAVIVYAMGMSYDQPWYISLLGFVIMIVFISMGLKKFKDSNDGYLKLGEAIKIGLGISLIAAIIYVIYFNVFVSFIEPDFYTNLLEVQEQKWIDQGLTDEQIEGATAMTQKMSNPTMTSGITLAASLFFGFIISLIAGLVMKNTKEE